MVSLHCWRCGKPLSNPESLRLGCGKSCCHQGKGSKKYKEYPSFLPPFKFDEDRSEKLMDRLNSNDRRELSSEYRNMNFRLPNYTLSEDEKYCILLFANRIEQNIQSSIKNSGSDEKQIEGGIFSFFNDKNLEKEINSCLVNADYNTSSRFETKVGNLRSLKIESMGVNLINENKHGADWVMDIKYSLNDKIIERKIIPIQSKIENKDGLFKMLIEGEIGTERKKRGLEPQSELLEDTSSHSYYMFFTRDKKPFLLPLETIIGFRRLQKENYPYNTEDLIYQEKRLNFSEFFIAFIESRIGEDDEKKIQYLETYLKEINYNYLELYLRFYYEEETRFKDKIIENEMGEQKNKTIR